MTTTTLIPLTMVETIAADGPAQDAYGRRINYLRISLTDRCNLRCVYCMPAEGVRWQPKEELLTDDELLRIVRLAADVGFTKIRLTGGEPTLRRNLPDLVREIAAHPAITDIAMTTNGILLPRLAEPLARAGLKRINVSLDTLDAARFREITRGGRLDLVLEGIAAAEAAGLAPVKLNAVVVRGQNDHEVADLAGLAYAHPWQVRFIEVMPFAGVDDIAFDLLVPTAEVMARIAARWGDLTPDPAADPVDPARPFIFPGARGSVGFISAMTDAFCATCNRMRLTADGKLRLCLLRDDEVDLLALVRSGASDDAIRLRLRAAVWRKPWGHAVHEGEVSLNRGMSRIGG